nr:MAG TPA: DNA polymerase II large subunit [Caudoviricetes sp.]
MTTPARRCPRCNSELNPYAKQCSKCLSPVDISPKQCPKCGVTGFKDFCVNCGSRLR